MRTVILVGLILHLVIAVVKTNYTFGDIISFPRTFHGIHYKHFAVYVGPNENLFGQGNNDIFHRIRKRINNRYCAFGSLKTETEHQKENYLDGHLEIANNENIIRHIKAMMEHCGNYNLFTNNCEHLATYVRYGRAYLRQPGTDASRFCIFSPGGKACRRADEAAINIPEGEVRNILNNLHNNSKIEDQDQDHAVTAG